MDSTPRPRDQQLDTSTNGDVTDPGAWVQKLADESKAAHRILKGYARHLGRTPSGNRDTDLITTAFNMGKLVNMGYLSRAEVHAQLRPAVADWGDYDDDLAEDKIDAQLDEAAKQSAVWRGDITKWRQSDLTSHARRGNSEPEESGADLLARRRVNGADLDAKHFEPLHYQIERLVPEGLGMLVAPPKKGKSFLVLDFGLSVAYGTKALGAIPVTKHPVLYLALEDGQRRLQDRSRLLLEDDAIPAGIDFVTEATPAEAMMMIEAFMTEHRDEKPLVIVDTFAKVKRQKHPGEESYLVDYEAGTKLRALTDFAPGSTVLVVHHSRKAEVTDFIDAASGTYGLVGSFDFVMVLSRKRLSNDAVLHLTGRDVIEGEYALRAERGILWQLDGDNLAAAAEKVQERQAEDKMGDRKYDVFTYVCGSNDPVTPADVAKDLGMDNNDAGSYLRRLVADGVVTKVGRGKYLRSPKVVPMTPR